MSRERVKEYLKKYNMDNRIITVEGISATVKEAAEALGTKEERIAKTLSFKLKDKYIVVVTSGDAKIDNAKYRHTFGEKAHMVSSDEVEEKIVKGENAAHSMLHENQEVDQLVSRFVWNE